MAGYAGRGGAIMAGGLVLAVAAGFVAYALELRGGGPPGTVLHAMFNSANGLDAGADVDLAGVRVGRVRSVRLDPASDMAEVTFTVDSRLHLPADSAVSIGAPSMTADDALLLQPGHDSRALPPDGWIKDTRDAVSLEQQVSNYIFGGGKLGQ